MKYRLLFQVYIDTDEEPLPGRIRTIKELILTRLGWSDRGLPSLPSNPQVDYIGCHPEREIK